MTISRYKIAIFLATIILMASCQKDQFTTNNGNVVEGVKTSIQLKLTPSEMEVKTRSVLEDKKEKEVVSLAVFIFDNTGFIISSTMHENVLAHVTGGEIGIDPGASMSIPAISGPQRQIYAIANYDTDQIENMKAVASLEDLKNLVVNFYANPIYREFGMMKIGETTQDIPANGIAISIELKYMSAKITLNVVNKSSDLIINNWSIGNIPNKSYLLERPYNATNTNSNDVVNQSNEADFYNDFSTLHFPFDSSPATNGVGTAAGMNYSCSFYVAENRQGTRPISKRKPLEDPYKGLAATDYKIKSWDAPKTATYITLIGQKDPGSLNPRAVLVKHYLGSNSYDNYDVSRGVHYIYTITINNLNDITIDTNVESYYEPLVVEQGADLESLDSHASFRSFKLHTEATMPADTKISIELANFANSTDYPQWLKLSLTPLVTSQIVDPTSTTKIRRWQQPGSDWSYVRTKFIPHSAKRKVDYLTTSKPFSEFSFFGDVLTPPVLDDANLPDFVDGKNSYPAYDNELPYKWAIRHMCNKITDIPVNSTHPTMIHLCAEEYLPDGNDERSAVVRINHEYNGVKTTTVYKVTQKAPIQFTGLPGESTIMLVENIEEYAHILQNELVMNFQMLAGLQWGAYKGIATSINDGELNTLQGVYSTVNDKNSYSVNSYLKKYGSLAGQWSDTNNGEIPEGSAKAPIIGFPVFSFASLTSNDFYNAIYNSTAARYCHEKNWDENGNGQIDPEEAKWYLPSQQELQLFWTYHEKLELEKDYYWSSTAVDDNDAYAISMIASTSNPKYDYDGNQQKLSKIATVGKNRPRVRCVRRIAENATNVKRYAPMVIYENKTLLIDCSNLTSKMYTTESKYGLSQNNPGELEKANFNVYKKLQVQLDQPVAVKYSPLHLNGGKCNESKGWRLPTQRELLLIWSVKDKIASEAKTDFANFNNGLYWTMNRGISEQYVVDFSTGLASTDDYSLSSSGALNYRCVKEVK